MIFNLCKLCPLTNKTATIVDCFDADQFFSSATDLQSICIDMEHSYIGDLGMSIACPNGQSVDLMVYASGDNTLGEYFGTPVDNDGDLTAGVGAVYCFTNEATQTINDVAGTVNSGQTMPTQDYEPEDGFGGLNGCPMNGDWVITITDNLGSDNGNVFAWNMDFNITPNSGTATPAIVTESWTNDATIVSTSGTDITVEPTSTGNQCYTYVAVDEYGCSFDTTICFMVTAAPAVDPITDVFECNSYTLPNIAGADLTGNQAYYTGTGGTGTTYAIGDAITTTITLYAYDELPAPSTCFDEEMFVVNIDYTPPVINCPGDLVGTCSITEQSAYADLAEFTTAGGSASDETKLEDATFTLLSETSTGICPIVYTRTYQIADSCGHLSTCEQTVTINDTEDPTATNPAPQVGLPPVFDPLQVTDEADNCGAPTVTDGGDISNDGNCPEIITREYIITDACLNTISVFQTFTIGDAVMPTASNPADINVECLALVPDSDSTLVIDEDDNGGAPVVTFENDVMGGGTCPDTLLRRYRVTDDCGNYILVRQYIIIEPTTNPIVPVDGTETVTCLGDADGTSIVFPVITDVCGNTLTASVPVITNAPDPILCDGVRTYTYTYTDCAGNTTDWSYIYTITYTGALTVPTLGVESVTCPAEAIDPGAPADILDACGRTIMAVLIGNTDTPDPLTCIGTRVYTYRYIACDGVTTADWTYTYNLNDNINPTGTAPADFSMAGGTPTAGDPILVIDEADNCTTNPTVTWEGDVSDNGDCPEIITRTYRITDDCLNFIEIIQLITIGDAIIPTASNPADVFVECLSDVPTPDPNIVNDAVDNGAAPIITHEEDAIGGGSCPDTLIRRYRVTDDCGNFIFVSHYIIMEPTTVPLVPVDGSALVSCIIDANETDVVLPVVTDVCGNVLAASAVTVTNSPDPLTCEGTRTYSYDFIDCAGNSSTWSYVYTIDLTTLPTELGGPVTIASTEECAR